MRSMIKWHSLLITAFLLFIGVSGFTQAVRKYSNEFLAIGIGARALGMSGSQIATVDNITAAYWNPAGLVLSTGDMQLGLMHSEYFAGIAKFDYGAIGKPTHGGDKFIALSVIRMGVDNIANTWFLRDPDGTINYDNIYEFSIADYAVFFSYAQKTKIEGLRLGGNFKIIHRLIGGSPEPIGKAWGFGLDVGAQYDFKKWKFAVMARDITSTFNAWSYSISQAAQAVFIQTNNEIPTNSVEITLPRIILGAAYYHEFSDKVGLLGEVDMDVTTDGQRNVLISAKPFSIDPHLGLEAHYMNMIFLRAGIGNIQRALSDVEKLDDAGNTLPAENVVTLQPNVGLGVKFKNIQLDYALTDVGNLSQSLYSHVFSLTVDINKKVKN